MSDCLGISLGSANLVAAPAGRPATVRRAVLTLFGHRAPEVGLPSENPRLDEPGLVLTGFVDRVGDPVPMVAADGSRHSGEGLTATAIESLSWSVGAAHSTGPTGVAVPAHWRPHVVDALRARRPDVHVVSAAAAALTALQAGPGLPTRGVVALCDVGAAGTSVTLADADDGFRLIGETVRYEDFSGDLVDQAVLKHVLADVETDPTLTSAVVSLTRLRSECRLAKERLSAHTATELLAGPESTVRLTRAELEALLREPLDGLIGCLVETLQRNRIPMASLAAVATVGGGARIPFVTQRLSEFMRVPVVTTAAAQTLAATGAAILAGREDDAPTAVSATAPAPLAVLPAAATSAETDVALPGQPIAWSAAMDDEVDGDLIAAARPQVVYDRSEADRVVPERSRRLNQRSATVLSGAAMLAVTAMVGLTLTMHAGEISAADAGTTGPSVAGAPLMAPLEASVYPQTVYPQTVYPQQGPIASQAAPRTVVVAPQNAPRITKAAAPVRRPTDPQSAPRLVAEQTPQVVRSQSGAAPQLPRGVPQVGLPQLPVGLPQIPVPPLGLPQLPIPPIAFPQIPAPAGPKPQPQPQPQPDPQPQPQPEPQPQPSPPAEPEPSTPSPAPQPSPTAAPQPSTQPPPTAAPQSEQAPSTGAGGSTPTCVPGPDVTC